MSLLGDHIDERLAVYGSLAPGEANHREVQSIRGHWLAGDVRGVLDADGWGSGLGYPGLRPIESGGVIPIRLFVSQELAAHWARLDEFEGEDYQRTAVSVRTGAGTVDAWIYASHPRFASPETLDAAGRRGCDGQDGT